MKRRLIALAVGGTLAIGALLIPTASQADVISDAAVACASSPSALCSSLFGPGGASLPQAARERLAAAILRENDAFTGAALTDSILRDLFNRVAGQFQDPNDPIASLVRNALQQAFQQACGSGCTVSF